MDKYPQERVERAGEVWGCPQRPAKRPLVSKSPSSEQTSAGEHQEEPSMHKRVSSSDAKVRHSSKTAQLLTHGCEGTFMPPEVPA